MELVQKDGPIVLFATPAYGAQVSVDYHTSMLATYNRLWGAGIECDTFIPAGHQWVDVARNQCVDYFKTALSPKGNRFTDILFMDADQGWDSKTIERIVRADKPVVAALPPLKGDKLKFHSDGLTGVIDGHLMQAKYAGTGLMRIKREVFDRVDAAHPDLQDLMKGPYPWPHVPYFQTGNTKFGKLGEDVFFCHLLQAMGEYVWIDSDVNFRHFGAKRWEGNLYEHLRDTGVLRTA